MGLLFGTNDAKAVLLGNTPVVQVYFGSTEVWPARGQSKPLDHLSWSQKNENTALVIVPVVVRDPNPTPAVQVTCNGAPMTELFHSNAKGQWEHDFLFGMLNVPAGHLEFRVNSPHSMALAGCSADYPGRTSFGKNLYKPKANHITVPAADAVKGSLVVGVISTIADQLTNYSPLPYRAYVPGDPWCGLVMGEALGDNADITFSATCHPAGSTNGATAIILH